MVSPMPSVDGLLYTISGFGDFDQIGQPGADINHKFNNAVVLYGADTKFRIPELTTNNKTGYDVLRELANSTNSLFGVDQERFFWKTRLNIEAQLSAALTANANTLTYDNMIDDFASTGFIKIGDEILSYCGVTDTAINNLVRGFGGTTAAAQFR